MGLFSHFWYLIADKKGKLTIAPGIGEIYIHLGFEPKKTKVKFCGRPRHAPGCCALRDRIWIETLTSHGFKIGYDIQTGPRRAKWWALKKHKKFMKGSPRWRKQKRRR